MKTTNHFLLLVVAFAIIAITNSVPVSGQTSDRDVLRDRIDMLLSTHEATVEDTPIAAVQLIDALYAMRDYRPAWNDPEMVKQLYDQVLRSVEHGLDPQDFHAKQLGVRLAPGPRANDPTFRADTEILCTDAHRPARHHACSTASSTRVISIRRGTSAARSCATSLWPTSTRFSTRRRSGSRWRPWDPRITTTGNSNPV